MDKADSRVGAAINPSSAGHGTQRSQPSYPFQISMFGLQLVWSTEMAYASPYLLSLGALATQTVIASVAFKRSIIIMPILTAFIPVLHVRPLQSRYECRLPGWSPLRSVLNMTIIHVLMLTIPTHPFRPHRPADYRFVSYSHGKQSVCSMNSSQARLQTAQNHVLEGGDLSSSSGARYAYFPCSSSDILAKWLLYSPHGAVMQ